MKDERKRILAVIVTRDDVYYSASAGFDNMHVHAKRRCAGTGDGYGPFGDSHAESNRMRDLQQSYQTEWFCMQQCRWQNHGGKYHTVWGNTTGSSGMVDEFSGIPCEICQKARNVI